MSTYTNIGVALAGAEYACARAMGVTIGFTHRAGTEQTLYATVLKEAFESVLTGDALRETRILELKIPTQANFAASTSDTEPVTLGDRISYQGKVYYCVAPITKDDHGYSYIVTAHESKTVSVGVK